MRQTMCMLTLFYLIVALLIVSAIDDVDEKTIDLCQLSPDSDICQHLYAHQDDDDSESSSIDKRKASFIRLGKRKASFIRFGKRKASFIRFG